MGLSDSISSENGGSSLVITASAVSSAAAAVASAAARTAAAAASADCISSALSAWRQTPEAASAEATVGDVFFSNNLKAKENVIEATSYTNLGKQVLTQNK